MVVVQSARLILLAVSLTVLSGCGDATGEARAKEGQRSAPLVRAEVATPAGFISSVEAVGTALANEQVTVTAPVADRIVRLNFDDGDYVGRGQVLAVLQQGQQTAQLREIQAREREAQQQLQRIRALKDQGFATRADYDARVAAAAATDAQADRVRADIRERVVRAPFSGWVSLRNISVGAVANQSTEIATISDISSIKLDFTVPETSLAALRPGLPINATTAAYPGRNFIGRIATIDPVIDPVSRAVRVRALLRNPDRALRPGMGLDVRITASQRTSISVPEIAVIGEGDLRFVFVVGPDGKVQRTPVRTGERQNGRVEILEGLAPGARVVTEGIVKVSDGMVVRVDRGGTSTAEAAE